MGGSFIQKRIISTEELDRKVKKILEEKYRTVVLSGKSHDQNKIIDELNKNIPILNQEIFENAITLVKNKNNLIPFHLIDTIHFASLAINAGMNTCFEESLDLYADMDHFSYHEKNDDIKKLDTLINTLSDYEVILVALHGISNYSRGNYGISCSKFN